MNDSQIVQLYWDRDERAIPETAEVYGAYCYTIAHNILQNPQDSEECVNDTYLHTWNAIPPQWPRSLSAFLGRITRNLALHIFHRDRAQKRGGAGLDLVYEELSECISAREQVEQAMEERELTAALNDFLAALPMKKRKIFVRRYWYADSISDIAARMDMSENSVSVTLHRLRADLRAFLAERGFAV